MIRLSYFCSSCSYATFLLDDAQEHANTLSHTVDVKGTITPQEKVGVLSELDKASKAHERAREEEILRRARDKNLISDTIVRR